MAKKYQNLTDIFSSFEHEIIQRATLEIIEMLKFMGVAPGEFYDLKYSAAAVNKYSGIEYYDNNTFNFCYDDYIYDTNGKKIYFMNCHHMDSGVYLQADSILPIHNAIRKNYNRYVKSLKSSEKQKKDCKSDK